MKLNDLNKVLPCNMVGKDKKRRKVSDANRHDAVADALAKCNSTLEIAALGVKFGLTEEEVKSRAASAKNFGLYRMTIGNRIRGIVSRIQKAAKKGIKLSQHDAAYPGKREKAPRTLPKAQPVKKAQSVKKVAKVVGPVTGCALDSMPC